MHKEIKSYVLRQGRISHRQQIAYDQWLQDYKLPTDGCVWDLSSFFNEIKPLIVEIGFGMGASLVSMAQENPQYNYIGVEVHKAGIGSLVADLHDLNLDNVRIADCDAVHVFCNLLTPQSLAGVQIFFPDPWPKKRHNKRRLIQPEFITKVVNCLAPSGFIHCATDWEDYALQMLTVLSAETRLKNQAPSGQFLDRPSTRPLTKFEKRGVGLGHGVWDLVYSRS